MNSSSSDDGGDPFSSSSSLFEGMVLFAPSDLSQPQEPPQPSSHSSQSQPLDEDLFSDLTLLTPSSDHRPPITPDPPPSMHGHMPTSELDPTAAASDVRNNGLMSRQISRKKKRGVRIGYAREAAPTISPLPTAIRERDAFLSREGADHLDLDDASSVSSASGSMVSTSAEPSSMTPEESVVQGKGGSLSIPTTSVVKVSPIDGEVAGEASQTVSEVEAEPVEDVVRGAIDQSLKNGEQSESPLDYRDSREREVEGDAESSAACEGSEDAAPRGGEDKDGIVANNEVFAEKDDTFILTEGNLELIRTQIAHTLDEIREMAASVYAKRKKLARRRREVAESVSSAATRYKDLEEELEGACEAEDFEGAERVSEDLAAAEMEKDRLLSILREAEVECDSVESKMQEVLQKQIMAEEEGARILEQFAKDAAGDADLLLKNAEEFCSREMEEWQQSSEELEFKRLEIDIEVRLIDEACSGMKASIEQFIQDDKREKERLCMKQDMLTKELEELLELVRLKEAEITENKFKIQDVEKKISNVVNEFDEAQSNVSVKYDNLQSAISKVEAEIDILSTKKKNIDENLTAAKHKRSKLIELAQISDNEAKKCNDLVALRKSLASPILKSHKDKMKLAITEKKISEDIHILREQISAARSSLRELSSNRASIQEEIASFKQRVAFIDKRVPELEAEKKVAAAARNFKEAGRIAAEAKALSSEKESVQLKMEEAVSNLEKMDEEIQKMVDKIQESEGLIVSKEKEAARAGYQRLCLVAAAARAERFAALMLGDTEEGDISLKEVEAAESNARDLLESYGLELEEIEGLPEEQFSLSLLINLSGKRLALMASSLDLPKAPHEC